MNAIYKVMFYCDDEMCTYYQQTIANFGSQGCESEAAAQIFPNVPPLPKDIVGVIVQTTRLH